MTAKTDTNDRLDTPIAQALTERALPHDTSAMIEISMAVAHFRSLFGDTFAEESVLSVPGADDIEIKAQTLPVPSRTFDTQLYWVPEDRLYALTHTRKNGKPLYKMADGEATTVFGIFSTKNAYFMALDEAGNRLKVTNSSRVLKDVTKILTDLLAKSSKD